MESEFDNVLHRHLDDAVQNVVWRCIYHLSDKTINLTKFLTMNRFNVRKPSLSVVMLCAMGIVGCKDDSTAGGGQPYDPSKPIELTDFYPKEGK